MTDNNHNPHLDVRQQDNTTPDSSPESSRCLHCHANTITSDHTTGAYCTNCGCVVETATAPSWLSQWNHGDRGSLSQIFRRGFHAGYTTPERLAAHIERRIRTERKYPRTGILESFATDQAGVLAYAASIIADEQLSPEQKAQKKAEKGQFYAALAMGQKPASAKQFSYLRMLGYRGNPPASMADASGIIDQILQRKAKIQEVLGKSKGPTASQPGPLHTTEHSQDKEV
jgi:hypothetical protein